MFRIFFISLFLILFSNFITAKKIIITSEQKVDTADSKSEAAALCTDFRCVSQLHPFKSVDEISNMCQDVLPEYCRHIKPQYTVCSPDDKSLSKNSAKTIGSCLVSIVDLDLINSALKALKAGKLVHTGYKFIIDNKYREDKENLRDFLNTNHQSWDTSTKKKMINLLKSQILSPIGIAHCLNGVGRLHYFCKSTRQIFDGTFLAKKGQNIAVSIVSNIGLFSKKKRTQNKKLKELKKLLETKDFIPLNQLDSYQISFLIPEQIKTKIKIDSFVDDKVFSLMRDEQLHSITSVQDINPRFALHTITRLSDSQFKAWATPKNIQRSPISIIKQNIERIDANLIPHIPKIEHLDVSVLSSLPDKKIQKITPEQAYNIHKEKIESLPEKIAVILENKSKEHYDNFMDEFIERSIERQAERMKKRWEGFNDLYPSD